MKKPSANTTAAILIPLGAAIAARLVLLVEWFGSPFRSYHGVPGLDMMTHLEFGRFLYENSIQFSLHRALVALTMIFNHGTPSPDTVIIAQMILGVPVGAMMGYVALHLTGKRNWALLTGLIAALYSPFLIHECFLTKDALVPDIAALSLFLLVWGRKHHFRGWRLPLAALGLFLPVLVHISTVFFAAAGWLWLGWYLRGDVRRLAKGVALPVLAALLLLSAHTWSVAGYFLPMALDARYRSHAVEVSLAQSDTNNMTMNFSDGQSPSLLRNYLKKAQMLIAPYEIPNNINHYFVKNRLPIFSFLPGPLLLIPCAGVALLLIPGSRKWRRRFNLPLLYVCCYALPIIAFMPLARYRMILCPALAVMAPYVIYLTVKLYREKRKTCPLPALAVILYMVIGFPGWDDELLRASDFVAYGHAQKFRDGGSIDNAIHSYREALDYNPAHLPAAVNVAEALIRQNKARDAVSLLTGYRAEYPDAESIRYYYAIALLHAGEFQAADKAFAEMEPPAPPLPRTIYYYYWGESLRMQKQKEKATDKYHLALQSANPAQRAQIEQAMALNAN
jgi:tetratricopeptide (TPR) repeat protein